MPVATGQGPRFTGGGRSRVGVLPPRIRGRPSRQRSRGEEKGWWLRVPRSGGGDPRTFVEFRYGPHQSRPPLGLRGGDFEKSFVSGRTRERDFVVDYVETSRHVRYEGLGRCRVETCPLRTPSCPSLRPYDHSVRQSQSQVPLRRPQAEGRFRGRSGSKKHVVSRTDVEEVSSL